VFRGKAVAAAWLSGIIDGEGHVSGRSIHSADRPRGRIREVRITNTDRMILAAVEEALTLLGVEFAVYDRSDRARLGNKPIFDIVISRKENLERLAAALTLRSAKAERLNEILGSYIRAKRPQQAEFEALVASGLTDTAIARRYDVTPGAVWHWRRAYGLGEVVGRVGRPRGRKWSPEERAKREAAKISREKGGVAASS
jgi:hypothetical protein